MEPLQEDVDFLEHFGVKGQKWGVRRTKLVQNRLDRTARIASGTASARDRVTNVATLGTGSAWGSKRVLARGAKTQAKIESGRKKVYNNLSKLEGINIKDLDYHQNGNVQPTKTNYSSNGKKAAKAIIIGYVGLKVAQKVARKVSVKL